MSTIIVPKIKYQELKKKAEAYEYISRIIESGFLSSPPSRSAKKIMDEFKKIGRYNTQFLSSLKKGLARSTYFKK